MKKILFTIMLMFGGQAMADGHHNSSFNASEGLTQAGDNAKDYLANEFKRINDLALAQGYDVQYIVVDAQDPRLYPNGAPFQPPSPAERVVVKVASNGDWVPTALIQNSPGFYAYKKLNGQRLFWFKYNNSRIQYRTATEGLVASVVRNRSVNGFNYINYLKGYGNNVSDYELDIAIQDYLDRLVHFAVSR